MEQTEHYYSGPKYFDTKSEYSNSSRHDKYGSFTNNRKHFQRKASKSSSSLTRFSEHEDDEEATATTTTTTTAATPYQDPFQSLTNTFYSTSEALYNLLPDYSFSSTQTNVNQSVHDPVHSDNDDDDDDISIYSKEDEFDAADQANNNNDNDDEEETNSVHGVDVLSTSSLDEASAASSNLQAKRRRAASTKSGIMEQIKHDNKESSHHPLLGMVLVTISAIFYALLNLSVKALMVETPWQELMFIRMFITWIATMIWIVVKYRGKLNLCGPSHQRVLLIIRAFFLWGAMFTCWWSCDFLPVGDGTTLQQSFPVWVSIFAHFVWRNDRNDKQRLDLFGWVCVFAGLLGIVFIAQPSFIFGSTSENSSKHRDVGIAIGMVSAICAAAQYVIVNYTKKDCHWLQVEQMTAGLSTFVLCPLGSVAFALYYYQSNGNRFVLQWDNLNAARWCEEIALGLLGFCALALLTRGSQLDAPARTAICLYLQIPCVYVGQCIMTSSFPDVYVFIGIFLVLCSVIVPAVRKLRKANKEKRLKERLKHRRRHGQGLNVAELRKYSDSMEEAGEEETAPLIQEDGVGGTRGVTVDWSSAEESTGNTDIDDDGQMDYDDIDQAVL